MLRGKQRGQSVVEFGIVAILFTLILFAIADFGLLLNDWLSVSSTTRQLGRDAAVGMHSCSQAECPPGGQPDLWNEAANLKIPGVSADSYFGSTYCCAPKDRSDPTSHGAAVQLSVTYYKDCTLPVGTASCRAMTNLDAGNFDNRFTSNDPSNPFTRIRGGCTPTPTPCLHPAGPSASSPGDVVVVTVTAAGAQVITPLVRPFFSGPACTNSGPCYVSLSTTITMRFEGDTVL